MWFKPQRSPLTARCLSPLPVLEYHSGHLRKLLVTEGYSVFLCRSSCVKWNKKLRQWPKPWHMGTYLRLLSKSYPMKCHMIKSTPYSKHALKWRGIVKELTVTCGQAVVFAEYHTQLASHDLAVYMSDNVTIKKVHKILYYILYIYYYILLYIIIYYYILLYIIIYYYILLYIIYIYYYIFII